VTDEAALAAALKSTMQDAAEWSAARERFRTRFTYLDDGRAAQRVLARVMPAQPQQA
jgi:CDP-glycerol glycerophosphotransferase (TagB/SpsB family)